MDEIAEVEPLAVFERWLDEAWKGEPNAHAMTLATATREGRPSARLVLLKGLDARGFVFYTNLESAKGTELARNAHAALCSHWKSLGKQIRVRGAVTKVSDAEADAYFASRPKDSQIGAWASAQSRPESPKLAPTTSWSPATRAARALRRSPRSNMQAAHGSSDWPKRSKRSS